MLGRSVILLALVMFVGLPAAGADEASSTTSRSTGLPLHGRYLAELKAAEQRAERAAGTKESGVFAVPIEQDILAIARVPQPESARCLRHRTTRTQRLSVEVDSSME